MLTIQEAGNRRTAPSSLENVTKVLGQNLNGSFTVWIRRALIQSCPNGMLDDDPLRQRGDPDVGGRGPDAGLRNAARRVIEMKVTGASFDCQAQTAMGGTGQGGAGFASCRALRRGTCDRSPAGWRARSTDSAPMYSTRPVGSLCDTGRD